MLNAHISDDFIEQMDRWAQVKSITGTSERGTALSKALYDLTGNEICNWMDKDTEFDDMCDRAIRSEQTWLAEKAAQDLHRGAQ